jgi:hypothetical protein
LHHILANRRQRVAKALQRGIEIMGNAANDSAFHPSDCLQQSEIDIEISARRTCIDIPA